MTSATAKLERGNFCFGGHLEKRKLEKVTGFSCIYKSGNTLYIMSSTYNERFLQPVKPIFHTSSTARLSLTTGLMLTVSFTWTVNVAADKLKMNSVMTGIAFAAKCL